MVKYRYILGFLSLVAVLIWLSILALPDNKFKLIACNVGQGDAMLAIYRDKQILIDGGPNNKVVDCLSRYIPFWDRTIEVVVLTHPEKDHYFGLIEVFRRYNVENFVSSGLESGSQDYQVLQSLVWGSSTKVLTNTDSLSTGDSMIHLDILHPNQEFLALNAVRSKGDQSQVLGAYTTKKSPNDFSVVTILSFGEFDALLTGDIGPSAIDDLLATGDVKDVEYIKVPHHGSKNGLTEELLQASTPEYAVISVGKNQWGHPHKEILDLLDKYKTKYYRTDEGNDVILESDGKQFNLL